MPVEDSDQLIEACRLSESTVDDAGLLCCRSKQVCRHDILDIDIIALLLAVFENSRVSGSHLLVELINHGGPLAFRTLSRSVDIAVSQSYNPHIRMFLHE